MWPFRVVACKDALLLSSRQPPLKRFTKLLAREEQA